MAISTNHYKQLFQKDINFYYGSGEKQFNIFSEKNIIFSILEDICGSEDKRQNKYDLFLLIHTDVLFNSIHQNEESIDCFYFNKIADIEFLQFNKKKDIVSFVITFLFNKNNELLSQGNQQLPIYHNIDLLIQQNQVNFRLLLLIDNQQIHIGIIENVDQQITLQFEQSQSQNNIQITYYSDSLMKSTVNVNASFKGNSKLLRHSQIINNDSLNNHFIKFEKVLVFINYQILPSSSDQQYNCSILISAISQRQRENQQICILMSKNQTIVKDLKLTSKHRLLQSIKYVHGSFMRSLVRNQYENSEHRSQILQGNTNSFTVIGYFRLSQQIVGTNYLPLITTGVFSQYYNFLNLYIKSDNTVELKYIHDSLNTITTLSIQNGQSMQDIWIGIGFGFDSTLNKSVIILTDSSSSQLKTSSQMTTNLPTAGMQLDICVTCVIDGGNYDHFTGKVSSVKIIYSVDITALTTYYFFNENIINKSTILSSSFDMGTYTPNNEYNLGKGYACTTSYAFYEGVCILQSKCSSIEFEPIPYQSYEVGKYYDSTAAKCQSCISNCLSCTNGSSCTTCRKGYSIINSKCIKCDSINTCGVICTAGTTKDSINYTCVSSFDPYIYTLNPILLSSRLFLDTDNFLIFPTLQIKQLFTLCYLNFDNNPMTLHSFLGGQYFTKSSILQKSWIGMPKGYLKRVQFIVLLQGNQLPTQVNVKINQQFGQLNLNYTTIVSSQTICSGSGTQTQSVYEVDFFAYDYSTNLDLTISSQVDGWAIRNLNVIIYKCHPTCNQCYNGGSVSDCTSCSNSLTNQFQCNCQPGYFATYLSSCFSPPCVNCQQCSSIVSNCQICEDITGKCVKCQSGYVIYDGLCKLVSQCTNDDEIFFNQCGIRNEMGLQQLTNNKIVQYTDYWKMYNKDVSTFSCFGLTFQPRLGNGNINSLRMNLPNYFSYHLRINISVDVAAIDSVEDSDNDHVEFWDGDKFLFSRLYQFKGNDASSTKVCGDPNYTENHYVETMFENKLDSSFYFKFISFTNEAISNEAFTIRQLDIKYKRCHPLCKSCVDQTENDCLACIDNAVKVGNTCLCRDGYYFSLERTPKIIGDFPGKCLKCYPTCKKCTGPSYQQCISCQDQYQIDSNNICKFTCIDGQYWDYYTQKCQPCNSICRTCRSGDENGCQDCNVGFIYIQTESTCVKDQFFDCSVSSNSFCGGSQVNHSNCLQKGWVFKTGNICVYCKNFFNGFCGGDQAQDVIDTCQIEGYIKMTSAQTQCTSCKILVRNQCGINEIQAQCLQIGWAIYLGKCINCSLSINQSSCACDATCNTCTKFFNPFACTKCSDPLLFYQGQCLSKCPNGSIQNGKNCDICNDSQIPNCFNCYKTCLTCLPFEMSDKPNLCTQCSNLTRILINGECMCRDLEDSRQIFQDCSYKNVAVLNAILSADSPKLTIDFGKLLNIPSGFATDTYSSSLCQILFTDSFLQLLGDTYYCQITQKQIVILIDSNADIFQGDLVDFKKNVLSFSTSSEILIDTFKNTLIQQDTFLGQQQVIFNQDTNINACDDITITFDRFINTVGRGFHEYNWSIYSFVPIESSQYTLLNQIITRINTEKQLNLFIPQGIITPDLRVVLRFNYVLKANIKGYNDFNMQLNQDKKIKLSIASPIVNPFYRNQIGIISIQQSIIQCGSFGNTEYNELLDFKIISEEYPNVSFSSSTYTDQEYIINIPPYSLPIQSVSINVKASLVSNSNIQATDSFTIDVKQSQLFVKINGGNAFFNYQNNVEVSSTIRDPDLPSETGPQEINISWKCIDLSTKLDCLDQDGKLLVFPSSNSITFQKFTFNPYTTIKITLQGEKSLNRKAEDSIFILFSDIEIPQLEVKLTLVDHLSHTVNLNEEVGAELEYFTEDKNEFISFSGSLIYEQQTVGIIKFDYFKMRFRIWNYFNGFKRDNSQIQMRFNVFNPDYQIPSMYLVTLDINFPPNNCQFNVIQSSNEGYFLDTKFLLQLEFCEDENQPLQYQFFYYLNKDDYELEKKNPLQKKRYQITEIQKNNKALTTLPSGKLLLMALAIDSKLAIYNTTLPIEVLSKKYEESEYTSLMDDMIDQSISYPKTDAVYLLVMLSEDILQRQEFKSSTNLNQVKIKLWNQLIEFSQNIPIFSTITTQIGQGISLITSSSINQSIEQTVGLLDGIISILDSLYKQDINNPLVDGDKLQQFIYQSFLIFDSLNNNSITHETINQTKIVQDRFIQLSDKIKNYLLSNALPNEDPIIIEGESIKVQSNQVTEKYICLYFICDRQLITSQESTNSNIYNIKFFFNSYNLYSKDPQYINYINDLKSKNNNLVISAYPIHIPSISNNNNEQVQNFQKKIQLKFKVPSQKNINELTCISKNQNSNWSTSNCKIILDIDSLTYSCICKQLSPTTLVESVDTLFTESIISKVLNEQRTNNSRQDHLNQFYLYGVFWIILVSNLAFIYLYILGVDLDRKSEIYDTNLKEVKHFEKLLGLDSQTHSRNQVVPLNFKSKDIENQERREQNDKKKSIKVINEGNMNIVSLENILDHDEGKENQKEIEQKQSNLEIGRERIQNKQEIQKNQSKSSRPTQISFEQPNLNKVRKLSTRRSTLFQVEEQEPITNNKNQAQTKEDSLTIISQQEKQQKINEKYFLIINKLPLHKKLFFFHNFFRIFYTFNPQLPRSLRFLVFYLRTTHSLAAAVLLDKQFVLEELLVISIINSITVLILTSIMQYLFNLKSIFSQYISRLITIVGLIIYYYLIISIVSNYSTEQSNSIMLTFFILYLADVIIITCFLSFCQYQIAKRIVKHPKPSCLKQLLYKTIELKIILLSIK